jgi:hypothetical protein
VNRLLAAKDWLPFFMYRKYGTPKMQVRGTQSFSVIRAIHGTHLSGQRFALLKIAPGNFFMSKDGFCFRR